MNALHIKIHADGAPLFAALDEFFYVLALPASKFDVDVRGEFRLLFRKLFVESVLDFSNLVCAHTDSTTTPAGDVQVSFHPSDLFLDLIVALRTGERDVG